MDENCIFCKIVNKELEASIVFENKNILVFMDRSPVNKGHVLIVPKKHFERFSSVDPQVVGEIFEVAQHVLNAIQKTDIMCEGANLFLSDGEVAGQEVPHSHLHITPRFKGDGHKMGFTGYDASEIDRSKLNSTADSIRNQIMS